MLIACFDLGPVLAGLLSEPDGIRYAVEHCPYGMTAEMDGRRWDYRTTGRTLELGERQWKTTPDHVLRWTDVRAHTALIPADMREELKAARAERLAVTVTYPPFAPSRLADGCGRLAGIGPLTRAQTAYVDELTAYDRDLYEPWEERQRAADARLASAILAALRLDAGAPANDSVSTAVETTDSDL